MNIQRYYELQENLDIEVMKKAGNVQNLVHKKIVALNVEIAEFAQELGYVWKYWKVSNVTMDIKILEEGIDVLHFVLSLGNLLNCRLNYQDDSYKYYHDKLENINTLFHLTSEVRKSYVYKKDNNLRSHMQELINAIFGTLLNLGYSFSEIENAYLKKNMINHQRATSSY